MASTTRGGRSPTESPLGRVHHTPREVYGAGVASSPISVALVNDYDVVLEGLARMLDRYRDRVVIVEIDANEGVEDPADIVLYDNFAQPESDRDEIKTLVANPRARRVAVYTWNFHPTLIESARRQGVHGYLSKTLSARDLVAALEAVHAGDIVVSAAPPRARTVAGLDWPGRTEGLTDRESEILALITQGMSNAQVAGLTFLSPNTVKSYIRTIYRKIGAASRTQAVLWGVAHGFTPDHHRIEHWRGGP
jgi:DNA-binding NarL/FixJ family response regulator